MKKNLFIYIILFASTAWISSCSKEEEETPVPVVVIAKLTYDKDIKSIFTTSCGPCHLTGGANANKFDDYLQVKNKISAILDRIQREPGTTGFMPRQGTMKLPATTVAKLNQWIKDGTLEK